MIQKLDDESVTAFTYCRMKAEIEEPWRLALMALLKELETAGNLTADTPARRAAIKRLKETP